MFFGDYLENIYGGTRRDDDDDDDAGISYNDTGSELDSIVMFPAAGTMGAILEHHGLRYLRTNIEANKLVSPLDFEHINIGKPYKNRMAQIHTDFLENKCGVTEINMTSNRHRLHRERLMVMVDRRSSAHWDTLWFVH